MGQERAASILKILYGRLYDHVDAQLLHLRAFKMAFNRGSNAHPEVGRANRDHPGAGVAGGLKMLVAILAALSAAALFAVATALQHRSAGLVADSGTGLVSFMVKTLRDPMWIMGAVAGDGGLVLHALALRDGPLTVVQPLLVTSVVFALALRKLLEHRRPRRDELGWACALAVGLVLFITISTPAGSVAQPADPVPTVVLGTIIGLGILGFFVAGRRATFGAAAIMLGTATGLSYAAAASLLKEVMGTLSHGAGGLATSWAFYALIAIGNLSVLLTQLAYRAGPLSSSLPAIMTVDPIVSLVIGVAVFDEHFRNGSSDFVAEALGLALVIAAAVGLTRSDPKSSPRVTAPRMERPVPMTSSLGSEASRTTIT